VLKLNASGSALVYATYLGGHGVDNGLGIAVDGQGSAYVTGSTTSSDFPTLSAAQATNAGATDAFVTKLAPAGNALVYSTYLGGAATDQGFAIAVDAAGAAYVAGEVRSANFPTLSPLQGSFQGGADDAFVTKFNAAGSRVYSTYLGGGGDD